MLNTIIMMIVFSQLLAITGQLGAHRPDPFRRAARQILRLDDIAAAPRIAIFDGSLPFVLLTIILVLYNSSAVPVASRFPRRGGGGCI